MSVAPRGDRSGEGEFEVGFVLVDLGCFDRCARCARRLDRGGRRGVEVTDNEVGGPTPVEYCVEPTVGGDEKRWPVAKVGELISG